MRHLDSLNFRDARVLRLGVAALTRFYDFFLWCHDDVLFFERFPQCFLVVFADGVSDLREPFQDPHEKEECDTVQDKFLPLFHHFSFPAVDLLPLGGFEGVFVIFHGINQAFQHGAVRVAGCSLANKFRNLPHAFGEDILFLTPPLLKAGCLTWPENPLR